MSTVSSGRTKVFISYSHSDVRYLKQLQTHLAYYERIGLIDVWDDTKLLPGAVWHEEIEKVIQQTKVAILLVSAAFLASRFIAENELPPLLAAAQTEGAVIVPLILSACAFEETELTRFHAVNSPSKPLINMSKGDRERLWAIVAGVVAKAMTLQLSQDTGRKGATPILPKDFESETELAQQLVVDRPKFWEYRLTTELLRSKLLPIKQRLNDLQGGLVYRKNILLRGNEFFDWGRAKCQDIASLITVVFDNDDPARFATLHSAHTT